MSAKPDVTEVINNLKNVHNEESAKRVLELYKRFVGGTLGDASMETVCTRGLTFLIERNFNRVSAIRMKKHFRFLFEPSAFKRLQES